VVVINLAVKKVKVGWKEYLKPKKTALALAIVFLALILTAISFGALYELTLESYQAILQGNLFPSTLFVSFSILLIYLVKRKFMKALLGFSFPFLVYMFLTSL